MLQLRNSTPFPATLGLFPDIRGIDTLHVLVRGTFVLHGSTLRVAEEQSPIPLKDVHYGAPSTSSIKLGGEMHPVKDSTDVILVGQAYSSTGRPVTSLDVSVCVGPVSKTVRVFGDRSWEGLLCDRISSPAPFIEMPLVYERASGGALQIDDYGQPKRVDPRNPAGMGPAILPNGTIASKSIPNLEDPRQLIRNIRDTPAPACFGFIAPHWEPRREYVGTYGEKWLSERAPYLPEDFAPRFFNAAHPDLICASYLEGGEPILVQNACREGVFHCVLPRYQFDVTVSVARKLEGLQMNLETVLIEPSERRICLSWKGSISCDKVVHRIETVGVGLQKFAALGASA